MHAFIDHGSSTMTAKCVLFADHVQPKAKFPELTWMLDNWCLMCPQDNSLKGTRDDFTDEVYEEIEQTMKRMQVQ